MAEYSGYNDGYESTTNVYGAVDSGAISSSTITTNVSVFGTVSSETLFSAIVTEVIESKGVVDSSVSSGTAVSGGIFGSVEPTLTSSSTVSSTITSFGQVSADSSSGMTIVAIGIASGSISSDGLFNASIIFNSLEHSAIVNSIFTSDTIISEETIIALASISISASTNATVEIGITTYQDYQDFVLGWTPVSMFDLGRNDFYNLKTGQLGIESGGPAYVRAPELKMSEDNFIRLDGIDDYVDISHVSGGIGSSVWTIEFWAKHSSSGPYIYIEDSAGTQTLLVTPSETQGQITGSPAPAGEYTHIVLTCDGSEIARYHNTNINDTVASSVTIASGDTVYIGYDGTNFIESDIGGIAFYDYIINSSQIEQNYSIGSAGEYKATYTDIDSVLNLSEQPLETNQRVWTIRPA